MSMKSLVGPLHITARGQLQHVQGKELFRQHINAVLLTRACWKRGNLYAGGERLMRPEFGCRLHHMLHQPLNDETVALLEALLIEDLQRSVPHLTLTHIHSRLDEPRGVIHIDLQFTTPMGQLLQHSIQVNSEGTYVLTSHSDSDDIAQDNIPLTHTS